MGVKLQKYQRQVGTQPGFAGTPGSMEVAGAPWEAVGRAADVVGGLAGKAGEYAMKLQGEKDDADVARVFNESKRRANQAASTMSTMNSPEEIEAFHNKWIEDERERFGSLDVSGGARRALAPNMENLWGSARIEADDYIIKSTINNAKRQWISQQQDALDGNWGMHPETGAHMNPEESHEFATRKLMELDPKYYEEGRKDLRNFGQNLAYKKVVSAANNNPDEAQQILDESNLTDEKLVLAADAIRDSRERQEKGINTLQAKTANDVNSSVKDQTLSRTELDRISKETEMVMGKEVPVLAPQTAKTYRQMLDASETDDYQKAEERIKLIEGYMESVTNVGRHDITFGKDGKKETEKMYNEIAKLGLAGASRATMEGLLNTANIATEDYALDRGWSFESVDMMRDIADAYTTLYVEGDYKRKNVDPVMSIINKTNSFIKFIEKHKGKPGREELDAWRKENMGELDRDMALNKFRDTYRIGEKQRSPGGVRVYKGNGVFEMEVD